MEVHEHFDGSLTIHYAGELLAATKAPPEAPKLRSRNGRLRLSAPSSVQTEGEPLPDERPAAASRPRNDHPWRKWTGPPEQAKPRTSGRGAGQWTQQKKGTFFGLSIRHSSLTA